MMIYLQRWIARRATGANWLKSRVSSRSSQDCPRRAPRPGPLILGNLFAVGRVNTLIAAGRARAIARLYLADPFWTLHAAAQQGFNEIEWP